MPRRRMAPRRPASPRQYKRRAEIIDAAARVFAELGYNATSTQNIAEVLSLKQASLYYYFASKEDALYEVCAIGVQGFVETLQEISGSDLDWASKVRTGILHHLLPLREKRPYVIVFQRDRHRIPGANRLKVRRLARRYERMWQALIEEGQRNGLFKPDLDPRIVSFGIIGMCNAASAWLDPITPGELERVADQFAELALGGIVEAGAGRGERRGQIATLPARGRTA